MILGGLRRRSDYVPNEVLTERAGRPIEFTPTLAIVRASSGIELCAPIPSEVGRDVA